MQGAAADDRDEPLVDRELHEPRDPHPLAVRAAVLERGREMGPGDLRTSVRIEVRMARDRLRARTQRLLAQSLVDPAAPVGHRAPLLVGQPPDALHEGLDGGVQTVLLTRFGDTRQYRNLERHRL